MANLAQPTHHLPMPPHPRATHLLSQQQQHRVAPHTPHHRPHSPLATLQQAQQPSLHPTHPHLLSSVTEMVPHCHEGSAVTVRLSVGRCRPSAVCCSFCDILKGPCQHGRFCCPMVCQSEVGCLGYGAPEDPVVVIERLHSTYTCDLLSVAPTEMAWPHGEYFGWVGLDLMVPPCFPCSKYA
jgi:hypothetical protein